MRCPACAQETTADIGRCRHCDAELPRGFWSRLKSLFVLQDGRELEELAAEEARRNPGGAAPKPSPSTGEFRMRVDEVFRLGGRTMGSGSRIVGNALVARGVIERGVVRKGDTLRLQASKGEGLSLTVTGVEIDRKVGEEGRAGQEVGIMLLTDSEEVREGAILFR